MSKINAEIVADSVNVQGDRLTSVLVTMPRIILSEMNTHRMLSKNTSSSRAIPFNKMVETIKNDPFIPIAWQKEHKGMQGSEYHVDRKHENAVYEWLKARDYAVKQASMMNNDGITKQLCNRLLEPFMWTTMLITGSREGWNNFFNLRCPSYEIPNWNTTFNSWKDVCEEVPMDLETPYLGKAQFNKGQAEIHMMALAEAIYDAYNESTPKQLESGQWHIPFENKMDIPSEDYIKILGKVILSSEDLIKIKVKSSVAMAARTSYTIVGEEKEIDYLKMVDLHDRLLAQDPPHSSPFEHTCQVVIQEEYDNSFKGQEKGWFRNYKGFKSYRQIVEENK